MYYNFVVQIPSEKGKILTKAKGRSSYVLFQYGTEYKPDKKYAIPKRTIIGKVDPSDEYSGRFYTPIPEIGNHRSDMKETAIPF